MHEEYSEYFNLFLLKTIKMKEYPSLNDLVEQQELFLKQMDSIMAIKKRLTIRLERPSE
jgi:lysyl-tRNA synthetase class II